MCLQDEGDSVVEHALLVVQTVVKVITLIFAWDVDDDARRAAYERARYRRGLQLMHADYALLKALVVLCFSSMPRRRGKRAIRGGEMYLRWNLPHNNSSWKSSPNPMGSLDSFRTNVRVTRETFDKIVR